MEIAAEEEEEVDALVESKDLVREEEKVVDRVELEQVEVNPAEERLDFKMTIDQPNPAQLEMEVEKGLNDG